MRTHTRRGTEAHTEGAVKLLGGTITMQTCDRLSNARVGNRSEIIVGRTL
ncbi:MAG: hypothetical protein ACRD4W_14265 [Nitrososphaeraceae archaeon]